MSDVENSFPPIASGKLFPWYLCLMYVYAFGEKHFCMFNANKVFVLYCICIRRGNSFTCPAVDRSQLRWNGHQGIHTG